jgi:hypothetical protein
MTKALARGVGSRHTHRQSQKIAFFLAPRHRIASMVPNSNSGQVTEVMS